LNHLGVKTLFIEPGSPWENGYIESFNGKLRDELLNREIFTTLTEAKVLIADWRKEYNHFRPHSSLRYEAAQLTTCWLSDMGGLVPVSLPVLHITSQCSARCGFDSASSDSMPMPITFFSNLVSFGLNQARLFPGRQYG